MKGVELPINTLIIFIIVLIVLLAIIGFFFGVWTPGAGGLQIEAVKVSACQKFISVNCMDANLITFDTIQCEGSSVSNLQELADNCYGGMEPGDLCNCPNLPS